MTENRLDILSITQLVLSERESWWRRMAECFHPDARIRLSWIDGDADAFVKGSIDMAARGMKARHRVGPPVVRLNGERAVASLPGASNSEMAAGVLVSSIPSICAMNWWRPFPARWCR